VFCFLLVFFFFFFFFVWGVRGWVGFGVVVGGVFGFFCVPPPPTPPPHHTQPPPAPPPPPTSSPAPDTPGVCGGFGGVWLCGVGCGGWGLWGCVLFWLVFVPFCRSAPQALASTYPLANPARRVAGVIANPAVRTEAPALIDGHGFEGVVYCKRHPPKIGRVDLHIPTSANCHLCILGKRFALFLVRR